MLIGAVLIFVSIFLCWLGRGAAESERNFSKTPPSLRLEKSFRLKRNKSGTFGITQTQSYARLPS
jgi:hypothetical protein